MADSAAQARDPDVIAYSAFSGVRNDVESERFGPSDLDFGDNIDIDNTGKVQRRVGRIKLNAAATHSLWSDGAAIALCVQGTQLKLISEDMQTLTVVYSGLSAGFPLSYMKINDCVYFSNGREKGVFENGVVRSWGLALPPVPQAYLTSGSMPAGEYQYTATWQRYDGQESGAPVAGRVTMPSNGGLTFIVPTVRDTGVAYMNVYLTPPNGDILYMALQIPVVNGSGTYAGSASEFSYDLKTQFLQAPPAGHLLGYYSGRAYVAVDDILYYSEPFAYELFNPRNYVGLNGRVTLIAPMEDKESLEAPGLNSGLFLGTDRTCGILVGNSPESFQYVPKTDYGAIEGALDYVDGSLFGDGAYGARRLPGWLSTQGVCLGVPGLEIKNLTRNRFSFTAAGRGAALFQPNPNRFVAISNF